MRVKLIQEIIYWIVFIVVSLTVIVLLIGCNSSTLDDFVHTRKHYVYDGNVYCPTEYFEEKEEE